MPSGRSTRPADLQEQDGRPPGTTEADRARRKAGLADPEDKVGTTAELEVTQPAAPPAPQPAAPTPGAIMAAADTAAAVARAEAELAEIDAQVQQLATLTAWPRARKGSEQRLVDARNAEQMSLLLVQAKVQHDAGQLVDPDVIHRLAAQLARWAAGRNIEAA
jgi:hypothetical protein